MNKFWNWVKNDSGETELYFTGPIAEETWFGDEITPALFRDELSKVGGNLTVWVNSPGGDCFAASQIYTMLRNHKGKVTVKIDGIAASAASVVAMAGDETYIAPTAMLMIHDPSTVAMGNRADMEQAINNRKKLIENESKLLEDHRKKNKEILTRHFYDMSNMMSRNEGVWLSNGWVKTLLWIFLPCLLYTIFSIVYFVASYIDK